MIPYGKQNIDQADIDSVVEVLQSDFLTQGPKVPEFEKIVSTYTQSQYAVALNSATSALHVACLALGVGEGDVVWTSPVSFVASANCALYCGASVDFVDIDPVTYNISAKALELKLQETISAGGRLPKVVIPVHLSGLPCDMRAISKLADEYGFKVIEDASHAIGARYNKQPIGCCAYSDITVFSFHPVKIITTAEGGVATTNSKLLSDKMMKLRSHGITRNPHEMDGDSHGEWYYQQVDLGFNYRMTELQAALGCSQFSKLDSLVETRHSIADNYDELLKSQPLILPRRRDDSFSALHLYIIRVDSSKTDKDRKALFDYMRSRNIGVNVHYIPIHTQPYYQNLGFKIGDFPESETYYDTAISIPMYPDLTEENQQYVVQVIKDFFEQ